MSKYACEEAVMLFWETAMEPVHLMLKAEREWIYEIKSHSGII